MPLPTLFSRLRLLGLGLVFAMTLAMPGFSVAQSDYPNRPITLVIPYGPAGRPTYLRARYPMTSLKSLASL